jgi:hypothetical protein
MHMTFNVIYFNFIPTIKIKIKLIFFLKKNTSHMLKLH